MNKENSSIPAFYDSEEDFAWGPVTLKEIKRDLKTKKKLDPKKFRRQTAAFIPLPVEENPKMYTANSTHSSKDYYTANESLESNLKSTEVDEQENFVSVNTDPTEYSEVVSISSDSEDDTADKCAFSIKKERFSVNKSSKEDLDDTKYEANEEDIILLSSSEEEYESGLFENQSKESQQDTSFISSTKDVKEENSPINKFAASMDSNTSEQKSLSNDISAESEEQIIPFIEHSSKTPNKRDLSMDHYIESVERNCYPLAGGEDQQILKMPNSLTPKPSFENSLNQGTFQQSSFLRAQSSNGINTEQLKNSDNVEQNMILHGENYKIPKINIISNTPIKEIGFFPSKYPIQDFEKRNEIDMMAEDDHEKVHAETPENFFETINESPINYRDTIFMRGNNSMNQSADVSQKENEYSYYEEENVIPPNSVSNNTSSNCDKPCHLQKHDRSNKSFSIESCSKVSIKDDSIDSTCDNLENISLNDTLSEMQKLIYQGYNSDSEDSDDNIIKSTPCKDPRGVATITFNKNCSKIPIPTSSSDVSLSSSDSYGFKVPKFPLKISKKTPSGSKLLPKTSPSHLKNIVSPVRLYIKNSPFSVLKQNHKPGTNQLQYTIGDTSEYLKVIREIHKNLKDSLPEIVYKPSKVVQEKSECHIIVPKIIKSLIIDRTVIKHENRKRVNLNESVFTVEDKLNMQDLSRITSDEHNMSVHTIKQGFNL